MDLDHQQSLNELGDFSQHFYREFFNTARSQRFNLAALSHFELLKLYLLHQQKQGNRYKCDLFFYCDQER